MFLHVILFNQSLYCLNLFHAISKPQKGGTAAADANFTQGKPHNEGTTVEQ